MRRTRRWPWFVATPVLLLVLLCLTLYAVRLDLLDFFLPVREAALGASVVGVAVLMGLAFLTRRGFRSWIGLAIGLLLLAAATVFVREYTAYNEVSVAFANDGVDLAGTLYLPKGNGPFPAVVLAQGSIRAPRILYHFWADHLVREGIAVLSFDKRGTGESGGVYQADNNASEENLRLLASDVAAGAEFLAMRAEVDTTRIGVYGLSMGGWTAPLAASMAPSIGFMVINSGPAVSVGEENYYSELAGDTPNDRGLAEQQRLNDLVTQRVPSGFNPRGLLGQLEIPGLWQLAPNDSSVPTAKSVAVLDSLAMAGRPVEYRLYPNVDHLGFAHAWPPNLPDTFMSDAVGWILGR